MSRKRLYQCRVYFSDMQGAVLILVCMQYLTVSMQYIIVGNYKEHVYKKNLKKNNYDAKLLIIKLLL